jgi:hypothetical protein
MSLMTTYTEFPKSATIPTGAIFVEVSVFNTTASGCLTVDNVCLVSALLPCTSDVTPPVLSSCPVSFTVTSPSPATWSAPTAVDNCTSNVVPVATNSSNTVVTSGIILPVGTHTITYKATDSANNSTTCSFVVTVVLPSTPCTGNLLVNSDFELYSGGLFSSWGNAGTVNNSASPQSGTKAAEICSNAGRVFQTYPLNGLTGTLNLKANAKGSQASMTGNLQIKFMNASYTPIGTLFTEPMSLMTTYTEFPKSATIPTGAIFVEVSVFNTTASGCLTVDNVCLTNVAAASCLGNKVVNESFESYTSNGFDQWPKEGTVSISTTPRTGTKAAEICSNLGRVFQTYSLNGLTGSLSLQAYAKGSQTSMTGLLQLKFMNASYNTVGILQNEVIALQSTYGIHSKSAIIPAGAAYVEVSVFNTTSSGCLTVDDVCLISVPTQLVESPVQQYPEKNTLPDAFWIYPNPASSYLTLHFSNPIEENTNIELIDNFGRVRLQKMGNNLKESQMDLSNFEPGIYYVRVHSPSIRTVLKKIVVEQGR